MGNESSDVLDPKKAENKPAEEVTETSEKAEDTSEVGKLSDDDTDADDDDGE